MAFTDAELKAELYKQMDRSPDEIKDNLLSQDYEPAEVIADSDSVNKGVGWDKVATAGLVFESKGLTDWMAQQGHVNASDDAVLTALNAGMNRMAEGRQGWQAVRDWIATKPATAVHRGSNVLEMALGMAYPLWNGSQQAFFGWIQGDSRDEILTRLMGEPGRPEDGENTQFMSSAEQLKKLLTASFTGKFDRAAMLMDMEPRVFESMHNDIDFQKIIINKAFNGSEDAYNEYLADLNNSTYGKVAIGALAAASAPAVFADPLVLAGEVKIASKPAMMILKALKLPRITEARAIKGVKDIIPAAKEELTALRQTKFIGLDDAKARVLEKQIDANLDPLKRTLGSSYDAQTKAQKMLETASAAKDADPTNPEILRRYVQAEKRLAEANSAVNKFKQGPVEDIYIKKSPKRNPNTLNTRIKTRHRNVETIRRDVLAMEYASPKEINRSLDNFGISGEVGFRKNLNKVLDNIRAGKALEQSDYDLLNNWAKLPKNVQKALQIKGISVPEVVREGALRSKPLNPEDWTKMDDLPLFNQRALLGADDIEVTGDAAKMLTEGAALEDVAIHSLAMPEYSIVGQGKNIPRGIADGHWVKEVADTRKMSLADGTKVFTDEAQLHLFPQHSAPGLVGFSMSTPNILQRMLFPFREPRGALRGTGIFERVRAGQINYDIGKSGSDEFLERTLTEAGIVKKGIRTGFRVAYNGKEGEDSAYKLAKALDLDPTSEAFGKHYDTLTLKERTAFSELRKWTDNLADRQGIQGKQRISGYFRHLFNDGMFENGARPIEFVGLPVTAEVNGSHLLPRLGKTGYKMDLLEVLENYNRAAHRKIYVEPMLQDALDLAEATGKGHIIKYTNKYVSELKGTPTFIDSAVDEIAQTVASITGHPVKLPRTAEVGAAISSIYYSSLLGGNLNYLIQNIGTGILNPLAKYGILGTAEGILRMATPEGRALAKNAQLQMHMSKLFEGSAMRQYSDFISKLGPAQSEFYVRGLSFHAALSEIEKRAGKTLAEMMAEGTGRAALTEAVNAAELTQHIYGISGRSPMISRLVGRGAATFGTQFLSFPYKQTGYLMSLAAEDPGHVMRYFGYSGIMQRMAAQELNIDATQWTGLGYIPMPRAGQDMPLSPGMQLLTSIMEWSSAAREGNPTKIEQTTRQVEDNLLAAAPGLAPMRKAFETAERLNSGAVTNPQTGEFVRPLKLPDELVPTILQTQSTQEHEFQSIQKQHKQQVQNELYFRKKLTDEYITALQEGDTSKYEALQQRLNDMGIFVTPNGNAIESLYMSRQLRWFMNQPTFMPFGMVPTDEDLRIPE